MKFDFSRYFHDIAVRLKAIAHTEQKRKFHRVSGIAALEELLHNLTRTTDEGFQLVIEDNLDSRFFENASTLLNEQFYVFYVLKKCRVNDFDSIEKAKDDCRVVAWQIFAQMFRHREIDWKAPTANANGLRDLRRSSVNISTIGPMADQYWGLMCSFTVADNPGIKYNADDWTE